MKCDACGRKTENNHFTDNLTILCADCARTRAYKSGGAAVAHIEAKAKDTNAPPMSMYDVSFAVRFDIGYADGIRRKLCEIFGAMNMYEIEVKENRS